MKKNHKNPHKTPEGYFDSFNERLLDKIVKEDTIIPANDGFTFPDGYFESVHQNIAKKLEPKVVQLKSYRRYYFAAASIAAIAVLTLFFNQDKATDFDFEDLASAEIDAYFEYNTDALTSYELAEVVDFETIGILDFNKAENSIESEVLLEYLDENVDEIEDLNLDYDEFK